LLYEQGNYDLALEYVEQGLEIDPENAELLLRKSEIDQKEASQTALAETNTSVATDAEPYQAVVDANESSNANTDEGGRDETLFEVLGSFAIIGMFVMFFVRMFSGKKP
jgi:tetratricopeptide (TPR) repeat protein